MELKLFCWFHRLRFINQTYIFINSWKWFQKRNKKMDRTKKKTEWTSSLLIDRYYDSFCKWCLFVEESSRRSIIYDEHTKTHTRRKHTLFIIQKYIYFIQYVLARHDNFPLPAGCRAHSNIRKKNEMKWTSPNGEFFRATKSHAKE